MKLTAAERLVSVGITYRCFELLMLTFHVKVVEWLTRSPAIGFPKSADAFGRAGSNPVLDDAHFVFLISN